MTTFDCSPNATLTMSPIERQTGKEQLYSFSRKLKINHLNKINEKTRTNKDIDFISILTIHQISNVKSNILHLNTPYVTHMLLYRDRLRISILAASTSSCAFEVSPGVIQRMTPGENL